MTGRSPNQEALLAILVPGTCLDMDAIHHSLDIPRREVSIAAAKLIKRGFVERIEKGCYQLTEAGHKARVAGVVFTSGPNGARTVTPKQKKGLR